MDDLVAVMFRFQYGLRPPDLVEEAAAVVVVVEMTVGSATDPEKLHGEQQL
jgi:hypothetical protein